MGVHQQSERLAFDHWIASFTEEEYARPYGCYVLRPKRAEVRRELDLQAAERRELYLHAVPAVEEVATDLFHPDFIWHEWLGDLLILWPLESLRRPKINSSSLIEHAHAA